MNIGLFSHEYRARFPSIYGSFAEKHWALLSSVTDSFVKDIRFLGVWLLGQIYRAAWSEM